MRVDLHPEELLERERAGTLAPGEKEFLDAHARTCSACAFERRAASDFGDLLEPLAGDDVLVARLVEGVTNASTFRLRRSSLAPERRRRVPKLAFIVAAAFAAGIAAAAAYNVVAPRFRSQASPPPEAATGAANQSGESARAPAVALPAPEAPSATPIDLDSEENAASAPKGVKPAPSASGASASSDSGLDAGELFARGNKARRSGSHAEAVRLYGELQRRFPGSREAHTSQLALGWLMLNQLGNPSGALAQFNGYLGSGGVMSEEALSGRALALQRLGRTAEERRAWQDLLARYPGSVNAERARQRLEELK